MVTEGETVCVCVCVGKVYVGILCTFCTIFQKYKTLKYSILKYNDRANIFQLLF